MASLRLRSTPGLDEGVTGGHSAAGVEDLGVTKGVGDDVLEGDDVLLVFGAVGW